MNHNQVMCLSLGSHSSENISLNYFDQYYYIFATNTYRYQLPGSKYIRVFV